MYCLRPRQAETKISTNRPHLTFFHGTLAGRTDQPGLPDCKTNELLKKPCLQLRFEALKLCILHFAFQTKVVTRNCDIFILGKMHQIM